MGGIGQCKLLSDFVSDIWDFVRDISINVSCNVTLHVIFGTV